MDGVTFIFALAPPAIAILLSLFANVSDAYIERASQEVAHDYVRAGLGIDLRNSIRDLVLRVSKGALLISNCIATAFSVGTGLFGAIYFLPQNYVLIFGAILCVAIFMLYIVKTMVRYGIKDLYIQRVRRVFRSPGVPASHAFTYGTMIDWAMLLLNVLLMLVVVLVHIYSSKP